MSVMDRREAIAAYRAPGLKHGIQRIISKLSGRFIRSFGVVLRRFILVPVILSPWVLQATFAQKQEQEAKNPPQTLTEEEKEIISNREMLENLPLLQDFDRIEFIDLLNEMEPDWSENDDPDVSEEKKQEGKEP
jgi:hypothetical protein